MIDKIVSLFKRLFHNENKEYERQEGVELLQAIKRKKASLREFNGRMHVSERGGLSLRFKTEDDERAYHKHLRSSVKSKWEGR